MGKEYNWQMEVKTVEDAVIIAREMLKDLCGYGWLDICGDDVFGKQVQDALVIFIKEGCKQ